MGPALPNESQAPVDNSIRQVSRLKLTAAAVAGLMALAVFSCGTRTEPTATPTVILISLDGFRPDYLSIHKPKTLNQLAAEGIRAEYLQPIFPTKTFPNHYTLVTGRYAENHGIVSNTMRDPELGRFSLSNRRAVKDGRWWDDAEPIWVTLHKNGITSAMYFWPGSEAKIHGVRPVLKKAFSSDTLSETRVSWVIDALALPGAQRPHLLSLYFEDVDTAGHTHGPEGEAVRSAVADVDSYLRLLVARLESANLLDEVNLIVTSDHGMAATSRDSVAFLDDFVSLDSVAVTDWDPVLSIDPVNGDVDALLAKLQPMQHVTFYKKEDMPARLHYNNHDRIRAIIGMADVGWRISSRPYFKANASRFDGGTHGYDPANPSMNGIFIARGPAFKEGVVVEGFSNVHIYELLCAIFGVAPFENNGDLDAVAHLLR